MSTICLIYLRTRIAVFLFLPETSTAACLQTVAATAAGGGKKE